MFDSTNDPTIEQWIYNYSGLMTNLVLKILIKINKIISNFIKGT